VDEAYGKVENYLRACRVREPAAPGAPDGHDRAPGDRAAVGGRRRAAAVHAGDRGGAAADRLVAYRVVAPRPTSGPTPRRRLYGTVSLRRADALAPMRFSTRARRRRVFSIRCGPGW